MSLPHFLRSSLGSALALAWLPACIVNSPVAVLQGNALAPDSVRIAYDVRGSGEPVLLFVHGWCCDREHWRGQVDEFSSDHRVVTLDLGGHGLSGANRTSWSVAGLAGDVEAVVRELDLQKVVLIGHSMGGPVCLEAAHRMPGRVIAVVGVDTLHDAGMEWPKKALEGIAAGFERDPRGTLSGFINASFPKGTDPELPHWVIERAAGTNVAGAAALMRDFANVDEKALLSGAGVPVRCINAVSTPGGSPPTAVATNRRYADFDAVLVEGVGHYLMLERPAEFNERLREVLAALPSPAKNP